MTRFYCIFVLYIFPMGTFLGNLLHIFSVKRLRKIVIELQIVYFLLKWRRSPTPPVRSDLVKVSTRKLWRTSSFSLKCSDFKTLTFEKISWVSPEPLLRSPRSNKVVWLRSGILRLKNQQSPLRNQNNSTSYQSSQMK